MAEYKTLEEAQHMWMMLDNLGAYTLVFDKEHTRIHDRLPRTFSDDRFHEYMFNADEKNDARVEMDGNNKKRKCNNA